MHNAAGHVNVTNSLKQKAEHALGESVNLCYQCGKCSAGCPLADEMDYPPNQILRMIQYETPEMDDRVLRSYGIWLCLSCEQCSTRCPKEVTIPAFMDFLRSESIAQDKVNPKAKDIIAFHNSFLGSVRSLGRLYEIGLIAGYKLKTWHLMQDVNTAPKLFFNGKLKVVPNKVQNINAIEKMFKRAEEEKL